MLSSEACIERSFFFILVRMFRELMNARNVGKHRRGTTDVAPHMGVPMNVQQKTAPMNVQQKTAPTSPAPTILRLWQVKARTGLSRSTIYQRVSEGTFPQQISLGARAVGWVEQSIADWIEQQIAASRKVIS